MPTTVVATLIANQPQVWMVIKEIEGPADEIIEWVRERSEIQRGDHEPQPARAELDWAWPARRD